MILLKIDKLSDYITLFIYDKNYLYRAGSGPVEGKNLFFVCLFSCFAHHNVLMIFSWTCIAFI